MKNAMTRLTLVGTAAAIVASVGAQPAAARPVEAVELTAKYGTQDKRDGTGTLSLRTSFKISDDSGGPPSPLTNVQLNFPKGAVTNGKRFPKCSKQVVFDSAGRGCKKGRIGTGTATATAPPIVPAVSAQVTLFNGTAVGGSSSIVIFALPDIGPNLVLQGALKKGGGGSPYGYTLDNPIPPIQTLPGAPNASVTGFDATVRDVTTGKGSKKTHYIDAPLLCNGTFFLIDGKFSYEGGISNTVYERFTLRGGPRCP